MCIVKIMFDNVFTCLLKTIFKQISIREKFHYNRSPHQMPKRLSQNHFFMYCLTVFSTTNRNFIDGLLLRHISISIDAQFFYTFLFIYAFEYAPMGSCAYIRILIYSDECYKKRKSYKHKQKQTFSIRNN